MDEISIKSNMVKKRLRFRCERDRSWDIRYTQYISIGTHVKIQFENAKGGPTHSNNSSSETRYFDSRFSCARLLKLRPDMRDDEQNAQLMFAISCGGRSISKIISEMMW